MAATFDGGVILGADSRTSTGDYIANRVTDKITPLSDSVYICRSGSAADTQNMSRYISWFLEQHEMDLGEGPRVETAAKLAQSMAYQNKNHLQAGLIVAGWDRVAGGSVFAIPLGGTIVNTPFSIGGSGSAYITGLCDRLWKVRRARGLRLPGRGPGEGRHAGHSPHGWVTSRDPGMTTSRLAGIPWCGWVARVTRTTSCSQGARCTHHPLVSAPCTNPCSRQT